MHPPNEPNGWHEKPEVVHPVRAANDETTLWFVSTTRLKSDDPSIIQMLQNYVYENGPISKRNLILHTYPSITMNHHIYIPW